MIITTPQDHRVKGSGGGGRGRLGICDMPISTRICFTVMGATKSGAERPLGGASCTVFDYTYRLRSNRHRLFLWPGQVAPRTTLCTQPSRNDGPALCIEFDSFPADVVHFLPPPIRASKPPPRAVSSDPLLRRGSQDMGKGGGVSANDLATLRAGLTTGPEGRPGAVSSGGGDRGRDEGEGDGEQRPKTMPSPRGGGGGDDERALSHSESCREGERRVSARRTTQSMKMLGALSSAMEEKMALALVDTFTSSRAEVAIDLDAQQKVALWNARGALISYPKLLPKVMLSVNWTDPKAVADAHQLLSMWYFPNPLDALQLLNCTFGDFRLRGWAVAQIDKLSDLSLGELLLQLTQTLK